MVFLINTFIGFKDEIIRNKYFTFPLSCIINIKKGEFGKLNVRALKNIAIDDKNSINCLRLILIS